MKTATAECFATIQKRSRQFKAKLVFDDFELTKAEDLKFTHTSSTSAGLTFGTCAIGAGSFSIKKDEHDLDGKEFTAYIGVLVGTDFEWINMGHYTITSVNVEGIVKSITFEDCISNLDVAYKQEHTYPMSARTMLSNISDICGIEFDVSAIPESLQVTQDLYGTSCRSIVKLIAQLVGTFTVADTLTNKITFKWYTENGISVSTEKGNLYLIDEPTFDKDFTLDIISNYTGTETITAGDENSTNVVSIANPMITQDVINSLYEQYKGFSYTGAEVEFKLGNPLIDVWDIITVEYKGKSARIPCMSVEHTFNGGFTTKIKSFVRNENTAFEGELTQTMNEVKTQITIVDGKVESKVSKDDVISSINQSPEEIKIQAERITLAGETTFEQVAEAVDTVNSWRGTTDTTTINGAVIETGSITAVQINVDNLFAGDINLSGQLVAKTKIRLPPTKKDYERLYNHYMDIEYIPEEELGAFDINGDGQITITDVEMLEEWYKNPTLYNGSQDETEVQIYIAPQDNKLGAIYAQGTNAWGSFLTLSIASSSGFFKSNYGSIDALESDTIQAGEISTTGKGHIGGALTVDGNIFLYTGAVESNGTSAMYGVNTEKLTVCGDRNADPYTMPSLEIYFSGSGLDTDNPNDVIDLVPLVRGLKSNIQEQLNDKLSISAENTISNAIEVTNNEEDTTAFNETGVRVKRTVTGASMLFGIGGGGERRGIYDDTLDKWVFLVNGSSGEVYVYGQAESLTVPKYTGSSTTLSCKVLYDGGGIFCNGRTTADSENSVSLADSNHVYKRLTLYFEAPYGLHCVDFPLDNVNEPVATWGERAGGVEFPAADNTNGATKGISYRYQWRVVQTTEGWTLQMTESGWFNRFNGMSYTADAWANNSTSAVKGTDYPTYNPRHNEGYNIYKVVGWTV